MSVSEQTAPCGTITFCTVWRERALMQVISTWAKALVAPAKNIGNAMAKARKPRIIVNISKPLYVLIDIVIDLMTGSLSTSYFGLLKTFGGALAVVFCLPI
jgi:hypothetical protein